MNNLEVKKRSLSYNEAYNWSILKNYGAYCLPKNWNNQGFRWFKFDQVKKPNLTFFQFKFTAFLKVVSA